jgi:hypothetical protein
MVEAKEKSESEDDRQLLPDQWILPSPSILQ